MSEIITINTMNNSFRVGQDKDSFNSIEQFFEYEKNRRSDINEHLETIKRYSQECQHITEMGVRNVVSTWAFLSGNPKTYVGVDILPCPIEKAEQLAKERGIDFSFVQADTLDPKFSIEQTDLLFIDTWHIYRQLVQELRIHGNKARKYIILHDTTSFGEEDEGHWEEYSKLAGQAGEKRGLWPAIMEFLEDNPHWGLLERHTHNNGLTILARR